MNQRILCHFELVVNEKYYQFVFQPGVVNFDDLDAALSAFKAELDLLKEKTMQAEADAKAAAEAEANKVAEQPVAQEPEVSPAEQPVAVEPVVSEPAPSECASESVVSEPVAAEAEAVS